jgi:hypothetical protein
LAFAHLDDERGLVKSTRRIDFFGRRGRLEKLRTAETVPILRRVCLLYVQCNKLELNNQASARPLRKYHAALLPAPAPQLLAV